MADTVSEDQGEEAVRSILRHWQSRAANRDARSMRRVIIKQGYLKKLPNSAKLGSSLKKPELRWFIFGVINGSYPYLEYYDSEDCIFNGRPRNTIFLDSCLYVTRNQRTQRHNNVFTLVLRERQLSLVADNRDIMSEWCRAIEDRLHNLHIIDTVGGDNDYVKVQTPRRRRPATMSLPLSALPALAPLTPLATAPSAEVSPTPELPATEPIPSEPTPSEPIPAEPIPVEPIPAEPEPIIYETLRQDAAGGNVVLQSENMYLVPGILREEEAQPVDLTEFLPSQQMNAASSEVLAAGDSVSASSNQPVGVVKKACRRPYDAYYVTGMLNASQPSRSTAQSSQRRVSLYANMGGINHNQPTSSLTLAVSQQLDTRTSSAVFSSSTDTNGTPADTNGAPASTTDTTSSILRRPSLPCTSSVTSAGPSACNADVSQPSSFRLPSYEESMSSDAAGFSLSPVVSPLLPTNETTAEAGPSASALPGYESPPSYVSEKLLELNANSPLKSRQVQQLQDEMASSDGIRVQLDKTQCAQSLALTDCFDRVWIAGWNRRAYPMLQASFHIGDELMSVNDQPVTCAKSAMKILKSCADRIAAQLVLRRLPAGYICLLRRSGHEFESLGLQTVGGTAEISEVYADGIAAEHGLPLHATNVDNTDPCHWWITEVNHRSLNLFYKDGEVVKRLSAAGSHLSFVAQPAPLIINMKRRLKTMKYYKDYLME